MARATLRTGGLLTAGLAMIGLVAACSTAAGTPGAAGGGATGNEVKITEANNGQPVSLSVGQTLLVTLVSNPTTGYGWSASEPGTPQLAQQGEPTYQQDPNAGGAMGVGGTQTFNFKAEQAGDTTLTLIYARPFETDQPPTNTFSVPVTVK
jgi:inhibitor of cysteine peptidase